MSGLDIDNIILIVSVVSFVTAIISVVAAILASREKAKERASSEAKRIDTIKTIVNANAVEPLGAESIHIRNQLVDSLTRLSVFNDENYRRALLGHAGLEAFIPHLNHNLGTADYVPMLLHTMEVTGGSIYLERFFDAVVKRSRLAGDRLEEFNQLRKAYLQIAESDADLRKRLLEAISAEDQPQYPKKG